MRRIGGTNSVIQIELPQTGSYSIIANSYNSSGRGEYLLEVSEIAEEDHRLLTANNFLQQGNQQYRASRFLEAIRLFEEAQKLYQALGDREQEALTARLIGNAYSGLEDYQTAIIYYEESFNIFRED
jgi:tetratricopeptide (TPR) repeat protein